MKIVFRMNKRVRIVVNILACACFIGLFIWGWGLSVNTAVSFLVICLFFLLVIAMLAAILGYILGYMRQKMSSNVDNDQES